MDEDDYKKNLMSGVKAYYVDDKVFYAELYKILRA